MEIEIIRGKYMFRHSYLHTSRAIKKTIGKEQRLLPISMLTHIEDWFRNLIVYTQ